MSHLRLSEHQQWVLGALRSFRGQWVTPRALGGEDGSFHSHTLNSLVRRGFVERRQTGGRRRAAYSYRAAATPPKPPPPDHSPKQCSRCGNKKPRTREHFYGRRDSPDGLQGMCIDCSKNRDGGR